MALVQTSGKKQTVTGGTAVVFNAPGNFTVGNWVIVTYQVSPYANWTGITGGGGTSLNTDATNFPYGGQMYGIASFQVVNSAQSDVTFTFSSGTTNGVSCSFEERDDLQTATPLDNVPAAVSGTSITSGTLAQANEVVYAVGIPNGVSSPSTGPSGFVQTWNEGGGTFPNGTGGYLVVSSTSPVNTTFTGIGDCQMATYKISGAAADTLMGQACL